ncbi:MAG: VLRF1 family aeRF1-type release factor [Nitriliruptoraceae bacterium]
MNLDDTTIPDLLDLTDEVGVLSFYVGYTPSQAADPQPTAPIEIRNQLKALRAGLEDGDREVARAVEDRLRAADGVLDELLDPKASGQGRALFVGVASGEQRTLHVQVPFRERVILDDTAYVRPLVAALDEGRPAGILVVSREHTRLLRWSLTGVEVLEESSFAVEDAVFAEEKAGPAMNNPANPQQGHTDRDRFEDRLEENRQRFFKEAVATTAQRAGEEGWDRIVVSAPPKPRDELAG